MCDSRRLGQCFTLLFKVDRRTSRATSERIRKIEVNSARISNCSRAEISAYRLRSGVPADFHGLWTLRRFQNRCGHDPDA